MIKKASDVKLSVLPLLISVEHLYYYEGPCRFGKGDALQPAMTVWPMPRSRSSSWGFSRIICRKAVS